ncbi:meiotic recombination [Nesidiocoris tenuis]|uniref:Meiotic recombination n=1 Tax=Nesidiocoris tenuis TaxID=355587 RepID=A0ABN7B674_9HEMI|nr:meiotic recombination [Nesidiocoris tenuis]
MDSDADSESVANHALPSITPDARPDDIFKILVATDIHLGVHEKDPIRGDDSFNTFEEILLTAKERDVDFILLGGDLFHDSKPTQSCYVRAISLIREHTMGDKPINMSFVADSKEVLHNSVIGEVNYQDPNQNVSFPIFSIHGNHDDPSGFGRTSALDVLSANGQLNYFGVCKDLTHITLKPILLRKGRSKLAVYGISHVRDERLSRLMASNQVEYEKPPNFDSWFKILVLHQNRVARAGTRHIHESQIPDFIDIVIWGHEHECLITPQPSTETDKNFYISQPGSPVATSLCEGEAVEKRIGVLNIHHKSFQMDEIKLKTVRPFVFHTESAVNWTPTTKTSKNKAGFKFGLLTDWTWHNDF